mmetsp:Transcript_6246/g.15547  ORF Transcript_6246/g.15547 Transcript_6246/m.15547 type:complete len:107 (-) Transcript_6246:223-543(-)
MTTGFSMAATWLKDISGSAPGDQIAKKDDAHDPILRDLRAMKDAEMKDGVHSLPPPRHDARGREPNRGERLYHQPKPKFVAHKDPTRGKKGKDKASSDRLGGNHMA